MVVRCLDVTVKSAKNLKYIRKWRKMKVYVVVSLSGNPGNENQQETPFIKDHGTNPQWNHSFSFHVDEAAAHAGSLTLEFVIMDKRKRRGSKEIGRVGPVTVLLERGGGAGDGTPQVMSNSVKLPSGETQGVLEFSYKFREQFTGATPPEANNEPVIAAPAAGGPPNAAPGNQRSSLAGWVPKLMFTNMVGDLGMTVADAGNVAADAFSHEAGCSDGFNEANM